MTTIFFHSKCGMAALFAALHVTGSIAHQDEKDLPSMIGYIARPGRFLVFEGCNVRAISFCNNGVDRVVQNMGVSLASFFSQTNRLIVVQVQEAPICAFRAWVISRNPSFLRVFTRADLKRGEAAADACFI